MTPIEGRLGIKREKKNRLLGDIQRVLDHLSEKERGELMIALFTLVLSGSLACIPVITE